MMSVQMIIGDWSFSISTAEYDEVRESIEYRWVQRNRLNRKPALQFQGAGLEDITFSGTIHIQTEKQLTHPQEMKEVASSGQALNLLASHDTVTADYLGQWVITGLEFVKSDLLGDGRAETIRFTMHVKEYGEDGL